MPQPGEITQSQLSAEDSLMDLIADTLEGLEESSRGQFLRQFFRTITQVEFSEAQSNEIWERILLRRRQLGEMQGKRASLKSAMIEVLASASFLRVPIVMEYDEFKKMQINAATDSLTGLYNRRLFDESFDKELNRAKRYAQHLAVVILDLHKLKEVNDQFGHLQGDQVLQLAASTLRKTLRVSDFAFRIGGDEFALLLPQTDPEQANTLCRRVRAQYEAELRPMKLGIAVTLDFGVAVHPQDGDARRALLRLADERLYDLKNSTRGGSRVIPIETPAPAEAPARGASIPAAAAPSMPHEAGAPATEPGRAHREPFAAQPSEMEIPHKPASEASTFAPSAVKPPKYLTERKWERVSLAGTKAYAVLSELGQKNASVLDLSYGGVALILENPEEVPEMFHAILHVPILPPVRVSLKKTNTTAFEGSRARIGCSFVS
ncbi:MAG: diguanylate cyclase domain-containing protein [Candidatus Acidiferrales bacterium]